ncbi:MAG TPA: nucleotidyltransferase family protein [Anaerolineae bacterium]|nr:nucleotidyltransferase family protein [Anaerolineae bacterium]
MDIFNAYPLSVLARVCATISDSIAQNKLAGLETWGASECALAPQTAFVLGVGALLYTQFHEHPDWPRVDERLRTALAYQHAMNRARVMLLLREFNEILAAFADAQIPVIPLKGILLLQRFYADPAARPLSDIDLLIRAEYFPQARAALESLCYGMEEHPSKPNFVRPANRFPVAFDSEHPDNPRRVEVHTRLEDEFRGTTIEWTEWAWQTSRMSTWSTTARELALAVLFAHLLSHTSRDIMSCRVRLIQLVDLALLGRILTKQDVWSTVRPPNDARAARFFYPALALTRRYFGESIADPFYRDVAQQTPSRLRAWCDRQTLFDVCWLGGKHLGMFETLALWSQSPQEAARIAQVMWQRRSLHFNHLFPQLQSSRWAWLGIPAYAWDRLQGSRRDKTRRGRWDYSKPS